ncbi:molybdate transport system substrate-binding protein [Actinomadura pelletieri DSM 43383]|uniref:Molybdate transport system substrate-binding protein n=1 Tax=Actinomadura pelletieri DSM 43383 TaxID=1120940 RepID=A0A495QPJ9_9ACTN|nr:molybdate ABC transporter substrate-binding protein [Actinomadura pelletieri]RKS74914.1 molybdate transport system substrate-binding protein [Actinomadura pelletieri DSM 43383]
MPDSPRRRRLLTSVPLTALTVLAVGTGCGGSSGPTTLTVLASSSLTEALDEIGTAYHHKHPDVRLRFEFGDAPRIAARLSGHHPGDVVVTADHVSLNDSDDALTGRRRTIAHTSLTIAVATGNPHRLRGLDDLTRPRLRVAVGADTVPVGRYTRQALAKAGLTVRWNSQEISARAVLDRVRSGEADAGLVYVTDLRSAGVAVSSVPIPADQNVTVTFPAAAIGDSDHKETASAFVSWLVTPAAQKLLNKYGFATPTSPQ